MYFEGTAIDINGLCFALIFVAVGEIRKKKESGISSNGSLLHLSMKNVWLRFI